MSGGKTGGMENWWRDLTAPRAADRDEGRREYRTRVLLVLQAVALWAVSLPVILGWNAGLLRPAAVGMVVFADLWVGAALWVAHRGRWRVAGIVSPALFVVVGLYSSWSWGLETPGVLSYAVAVVVAGMLHGTWAQWTVVGLSLSVHLIAGWLCDPVWAGGLVRVAVMVGGALVGIALLQSFATRQLESAIGEARAHADRLAERTAELVRANTALGQEVADRVEAQSDAQHRLQEMELVNQLGSLMAGAGEVTDVLPAVCAELARFLRVGQARLARLDPVRGVVREIAGYHSPEKSARPVDHDPCMAYVLEHCAPLVVAAGRAGPELAAVQEMMQRQGAESLLAVPLTVGGKAIGALEFTAPDAVAFDPRHVDLVQQVADQAGQALMRQDAEADLRASEANYRTTVNSMEDVIHAVDSEFRITLYNTAFERLCEKLGVETGEINRTVSGTFSLLPDRLRHEYRRIFESGQMLITEETTTIEGREIILEVRMIPLVEHGRVTRITTVARDITESKRAQEQIKTSLREKEVLLREVHHRVRNNLQVVSSLLSMQARAIQDEQAVHALRECEGRVASMARIHDQLHRSKSLDSIDMEQYVRELAASLIGLYGASAVGVAVDAAGVRLPVDQAIPCGLILNELITNCLKHAFPGGRSGQIDIVLGRRDGWCELGVSDNGVGLPADLDLEEPTTLGLIVVKTLVEQLRGELEVEGDAGVVVRLSFVVKVGEAES